MEDVDDESNQNDGYKDVDKAADIRGITSFGQQEPFQLFSQNVTSWGNKKQADPGGYPACIRLLYMIFHDTYFSIWDLPCKSQYSASLEKFCANGVPLNKKELLAG